MATSSSKIERGGDFGAHHHQTLVSTLKIEVVAFRQVERRFIKLNQGVCRKTNWWVERIVFRSTLFF